MNSPLPGLGARSQAIQDSVRRRAAHRPQAGSYRQTISNLPP